MLALATLLEVNYQNTISMKDNSNLPRSQTASSEWDRQKKSEGDLAKMMKELWTLLDEQSEGCIPSGIIFLPGKRLPEQGFGWAPLTWMSGQTIDHPDPLSIPHLGANIAPGKGLSVRYPGFLLHSKQPDTVFWPEDEPIRFPSDSTLLEWYEVEQADASMPSPKGKKLEKMRFAILLCRPKPRELYEIALLVHIAREVPRKVHGSTFETKIYEAQIICRVRIKREIGIDRESKWKEFSQRTDDETKDFICGEELNSDQQWILDGYSEDLHIGQIASDETTSSSPISASGSDVAPQDLPKDVGPVTVPPWGFSPGRNDPGQFRGQLHNPSNYPNTGNNNAPSAPFSVHRASSWSGRGNLSTVTEREDSVAQNSPNWRLARTWTNPGESRVVLQRGRL